MLKLIIKNGKRKAYYKEPSNGLYYKITIAEYNKAKETGVLFYGLGKINVA